MSSVKIKFIILCIMLPINFSFAKVSADLNNYNFLTEVYPPYNYESKGELQGISTDLLDIVFQDLGINKTKSDVVLFPWARAYAIVQKKPNSVLYSMTRTENREQLFKWAGPIIKTKVSLIANKSSKIKINDVSDINNYKVGAVRSDIGEQELLAKNVSKKNISIVTDLEQNIRKLTAKRIDILAYEESSVYWRIKMMGENPDDFETIYTLKEGDLYYAFSKETPDEVIGSFQKAIDKVKSSDKYQEILIKYLK